MELRLKTLLVALTAVLPVAAGSCVQATPTPTLPISTPAPSSKPTPLAKPPMIVYVSNWDILVMNADGSGKTNLTNSPEMDREPRWSPDGNKIAFVSGPNLQTGDVNVMNRDGTNLKRVTISGPVSYISWSPDGSKVLFEHHVLSQQTLTPGDYNGVRVIDSEGTGEVKLTNENEGANQPVWSPDGRRIAYVTGGGDYAEIYVMNADGSSKRNATNQEGADFNPAWSPDGQMIAFTHYRVSGYTTGARVSVFAMRADGTDKAQLTNDPESANMYPEWSPDGTKIAFRSVKAGPKYEVHVMNRDGSGTVNLSADPASDRDFRWSPDSTKLVFVRGGDSDYPYSQDRTAAICTVNADGSGLMNLTNKPGWYVGPSWSP